MGPSVVSMGCSLSITSFTEVVLSKLEHVLYVRALDIVIHRFRIPLFVGVSGLDMYYFGNVSL